jgi:hypothetical protein
MIFLNSNDQNLIVPNVPPFNRYARRKPEALEGWSGKHFDSEGPLRRCDRPRRKINESPVRRAISSNCVGSLTIMKTGGGQGGENCKTAETVPCVL